MDVDSSSFSSGKSGRRAPYLKKNLPVDRTKPQRSTLGQPRSLPATPLLRGQRSPADNSANVVAKLDALRIPLIHLLAMSPDSEQNLASKTRVSEEICLRILREVANRVGKQWQLVDDVYKDLDLWDFPYPSQMDRDQAITNTRAAFNRLRLSREASEWQMILAPGDRGKVDPNPAPPQPVKLPPKLAPPPSITVTAESAETSKPSLQITKKASGGEPIARSASQSTAKAGKPAQKDAISRIIGKKGKKPAAAKATAAKPKGPIGRPPKSAAARTSKASQVRESTINSRVKSAERVEDSDEDIEMEDVKLSPPKVLEKKVASPPLRQTTTAMTKASPTASVNSDRDRDDSRLKSKKALTPNAIKPPVKKQRREAPKSKNSSFTSAKRNGNVKAPSRNPKPLPSRDNFARRSSSNSPPKPSPLGSSPPINASDIDNTSAASSPSFPTSIAGASTPGQSPLGPIALVSRAVKSRYLPVVSPPLKRKAAPAERDDRTSNSRAGANRPPTSAAAASTNQPNKRRNTNSPDAYTIQLARQFKEDHARYERLYREVQAITDSFKKKEKFDTVLTMHRDLESLKARISRISQAASVH